MLEIALNKNKMSSKWSTQNICEFVDIPKTLYIMEHNIWNYMDNAYMYCTHQYKRFIYD